jgi:hypothetical protein
MKRDPTKPSSSDSNAWNRYSCHDSTSTDISHGPDWTDLLGLNYAKSLACVSGHFTDLAQEQCSAARRFKQPNTALSASVKAPGMQTVHSDVIGNGSEFQERGRCRRELSNGARASKSARSTPVISTAVLLSATCSRRSYISAHWICSNDVGQAIGACNSPRSLRAPCLEVAPGTAPR